MNWSPIWSASKFSFFSPGKEPLLPEAGAWFGRATPLLSTAMIEESSATERTEVLALRECSSEY